MALYALSDTHLSLSTDKPMDIFGSRWVNFETLLKENWQRLVKPTDTVVINGDISWGMTLEEARADLRFLDELNGRKIISCGNHDYWWNTIKKMKEFLAQSQITTIDFLHNNAFLVDNYVICGTRAWYYDPKTSPPDVDYKKIVQREAARLELSLNEGKKLQKNGETPLVFLHFPPVFGEFVVGEIIEVLKKFGVTQCFYGHIHGKYDMPRAFEFDGINFHIVSADYLQFCPFEVKL